MADKQLPVGWQTVKLSDLGEVNRGRSRHRPRYAEHLYGGPYPFVQTGDIRESGGRIVSHQQTYSEAGLAQSRLWPAGTMCITIAANIAETAILTYPACFPDSVVGFVGDPAKCSAVFIEYVFRYLRHRIQHEATGSVQDNINLATLERLRFSLPPLREQQAIACVLEALDDKIEFNRQRTRTLEAMARAIFQSWFVDFDAVKAKAARRKPAGLKPELAALFPASFQESELGPIPKGWGVGSILETAQLLSGGTPKTAEPAFWDGPIPWASAKDISQCGEAFLIGTERSITQIGLDNSATQIVPALSSVVVARGATTGRLTMFGSDIAMNQTCYALRSKSGTPRFVYMLLRFEIRTLVHAAHGSVFDTITTATFRASRLRLPPPPIALAFENLVTPIFDQILASLEQSRTLGWLRDCLLPKLISGELQLPDAERIVGRAL